MSLAKVLLLGASACLLAGCSSMKIEVSVLDPKVVSRMAEEDRLSGEIPELIADNETVITGRFNALRNEHFRAYVKVATDYRAQAEKLPAGSDDRVQLETAADSHDQLPPSIVKLYDDTELAAKSSIAALRDLWQQYKAATSDAVRDDLRRKLLWLLEERRRLLISFSSVVLTDLSELERNVKTQPGLGAAERLRLLSSLQSQTVTAATAVIKQLVDSGGLEHSPYAFYVANAPQDKWAGKYDKTVARGIFGNSDIAIKALGPTNFTIKGLSFNPADVAATASKVATQTVLLASQIAGVPVKVAGSSTPVPALAQTSNRLATTLASNEQTTLLLNAHREALLRIAASILREKKTVQDDARRGEALNAIRAVYDSQVTRIPVAVPNGG